MQLGGFGCRKLSRIVLMVILAVKLKYGVGMEMLFCVPQGSTSRARPHDDVP